MKGFFAGGLLTILGRYIAVLAVLGALVLFLAIIALIYGQTMVSGTLGPAVATKPPSQEAVEKRLSDAKSGAEAARAAAEKRKSAARTPKLTGHQRNLVEFATLVDPQKGRAYFAAYDTALRAANSCARNERQSFSAGLKNAYEKLSPDGKALGYQVLVASYCGLWRDAARGRVLAEQRFFRNKREGRRVRDVSIGVVVGALGFLAILALPLALIAIAGNTRALTDLAEAIARSDKTPGAGTMLIAVLAAGLMAGPAFAQGTPPALPGPEAAAPGAAPPPVMTEQQILMDQARKKREAALASRRKHVGQVYVFQPSWTVTHKYGAKRGTTGTLKAYTWFYRAPYTLWQSLPKTRFRPVRLTRFTVLALDTVSCYATSYTQRRKTGAYRCYFYRVDLGGGLTAYLEAGRSGPPVRYRSGARSRLPTSVFSGTDALAFISKTPRGPILAAMPDELNRREAAEKQRKAADSLAARARREREIKAQAARARQTREIQAKLYKERMRKQEAERKARYAREREARIARARQREEERKATQEKYRKERQARQLAARRAALAKRFPDPVIDGILARRVEEGWTAAAVRASWGRPNRVLKVPPSDELWVYRDKHVIFSDGTVRKVVEAKQEDADRPAPAPAGRPMGGVLKPPPPASASGGPPPPPLR